MTYNRNEILHIFNYYKKRYESNKNFRIHIEIGKNERFDRFTIYEKKTNKYMEIVLNHSLRLSFHVFFRCQFSIKNIKDIKKIISLFIKIKNKDKLNYIYSRYFLMQVEVPIKNIRTKNKEKKEFIDSLIEYTKVYEFDINKPPFFSFLSDKSDIHVVNVEFIHIVGGTDDLVSHRRVDSLYQFREALSVLKRGVSWYETNV